MVWYHNELSLNLSLNLFTGIQDEARLLEVMCLREIDKEDDAATLFRGSSLASTLLDQYMELTCQQFLETALDDVIAYVVNNEQLSAEVGAGAAGVEWWSWAARWSNAGEWGWQVQCECTGGGRWSGVFDC